MTTAANGSESDRIADELAVAAAAVCASWPAIVKAGVASSDAEQGHEPAGTPSALRTVHRPT